MAAGSCVRRRRLKGVSGGGVAGVGGGWVRGPRLRGAHNPSPQAAAPALARALHRIRAPTEEEGTRPSCPNLPRPPPPRPPSLPPFAPSTVLTLPRRISPPLRCCRLDGLRASSPTSAAGGGGCTDAKRALRDYLRGGGCDYLRKGAEGGWGVAGGVLQKPVRRPPTLADSCVGGAVGTTDTGTGSARLASLPWPLCSLGSPHLVAIVFPEIPSPFGRAPSSLVVVAGVPPLGCPLAKGTRRLHPHDAGRGA